MMREAAIERCKAARSTSFAADLGKWLTIMEAYLGGGHAYHATMPTDALRAPVWRLSRGCRRAAGVNMECPSSRGESSPQGI